MIPTASGAAALKPRRKEWHRAGRGLAAALLATLSVASASAEPPDPEALVNALEARGGVHPTFRRAHAKGVCAEGTFIANGEGLRVSKAKLFEPGAEAAVIARFSIAGGDPKASDRRRELRSMALAMAFANGEEFRTAMNHAPVFAVNRPEHFLGLQLSRVSDPATGKPDPQKVKDFDDSHPDTQPLRDWLANQPLPKGFAHAAFFSAHAFAFIDAAGSRRYGKWEFQPAAGFAAISADELATQPDDFLFLDVRAAAASVPLRWTMVLVLGEDGDPLTDPTLVWPKERERIDVGTLTISRVEPDAGGACRDITFDPLILPVGIEPTEDPVLLARSAPYAISLGRRLSEASE